MQSRNRITASAPLARAVRQLSESARGALVVVDEEGYPQGILSEHEIVRRMVGDGVDLSQAHVAELMARKIETVGVGYHFVDAVEALKRSETPFVAVVDERGKAVGLISYPDVLELLGFELSEVAGKAGRPGRISDRPELAA